MAESPNIVELEDGSRERMETLGSRRMAPQDGISTSFAAEQKLSSSPSDWSQRTEESKGHNYHDDDVPSKDSKFEGIVHAEEGKQNEKNEMIPFFKLFDFADSFDVVLMLLGTIGAVGSGLSQPLMTLLFGRLIDSFGNNSNDLEKLESETSFVALLYIFAGVGAAVAGFFEVACWMITGERQAFRIRCLYLKAILRQDVAFFDRQVSSGEVVSRMTEDTVLIQDAMGEKVGNAIQLLSRFFSGFILAFYGSWKLSVVLVAVIPLLAVVGGFMASAVSTLALKGQAAYSEAGLVVVQVLAAIRTVACYGGEKKAVQAYDKALEKAEEAGVRQGVVMGLGAGVTLFIMFAMYALSLWYGSRLVVDGDMTAGEVITVIFAVVMGGMALGQISPSLSTSASGRVAAFKMFEVINRKSEIDITDLKGVVLDNVNGDIELRNVTFAYPTRSELPIFFNFKLFVPAGTTAALVGESGSGKSSVLSLVERFYDPQAGQVLLDGVDIKSMQLKWLRQQIALVSQEPVLFCTSIMENISYGKEGATLEEVQAAARVANASTFIDKMPKGYETLVGEGGVQMSGGQKQRIAIARAILKDPRILLLDEATSALDADSERLVQEALEKVMISRTTLVVAHRLSTIRNADMISVIRNGTILETGTHAELIENPDGGYSQLIRIQALQQAELEEVGLESFVGHQEEENTLETRGGSSPFSRGSGFDGTRQVSVLSPKSTRSRSSLTEESMKPGTPADTDVELGIERSIPGLVEDEEKGRKGSLWRLAKMNKSETPYFVVGSIGAAGQGVVLPIFGFFLSAIIEMLFKSPPEIQKEGRFWALMLVALATETLLASPIQKWCFAVIGCSLVRHVRKESLSRVLRQEIGWFDDDKNSSGAIGGRLYSDAGAIRGVLGDSLSLIVQNLATITAGLAISFSSGWELSCVVLGLVPLLGMQGAIAGKRMKGFAKSAKKNYEKASRVANDAVSNIRTVASFCAEDKVVNFYEEHCKDPLKNGIKRGLVSGLYIAFATFTLFASYSLAFWAGSKFVSMGRMSFERVFRVFLSIALTALAVMQSFTLAPDLAKAQAAVESIFGILDRKSKIDPMNKAGKMLDNLKGLIEFRHVHFRYPARPDITVLQDLSFILSAGQTLALVGESGSGKSTVISLLERFYDPNSGSILIDNFEIRTLQLEWLRKQIGLVSQEPVLFDGTIKMNIMYGKEAVTQEEIEAAAISANAHKFITNLPELYETPVGSRKMKLSGGQKQRVAIARAIIRNPKILLLDEATSALDAESEQVVHEALERLSEHRTTIVVAHRLSTVKNASQIAVMKNGSIIEKGTYDQLISRPDSAFSALVKLSNNVRS